MDRIVTAAKHVVVMGSAHLSALTMDTWLSRLVSAQNPSVELTEEALNTKVDIISLANMLRHLERDGETAEAILGYFAACLHLHKCSELYLLQHEDRQVPDVVIDKLMGVAHRVLPETGLKIIVKGVEYLGEPIRRVGVACVDPDLHSMRAQVSDMEGARFIRIPGPAGLLAGTTTEAYLTQRVLVENLNEMFREMGVDRRKIPVTAMGHQDCMARALRAGRALTKEEDARINEGDTVEANRYLQHMGFKSAESKNTSGSFLLVRAPGPVRRFELTDQLSN